MNSDEFNSWLVMIKQRSENCDASFSEKTSPILESLSLLFTNHYNLGRDQFFQWAMRKIYQAVIDNDPELLDGAQMFIEKAGQKFAQG